MVVHNRWIRNCQIDKLFACAFGILWHGRGIGMCNGSSLCSFETGNQDWDMARYLFSICRICMLASGDIDRTFFRVVVLAVKENKDEAGGKTTVGE